MPECVQDPGVKEFGWLEAADGIFIKTQVDLVPVTFSFLFFAFQIKFFL